MGPICIPDLFNCLERRHTGHEHARFFSLTRPTSGLCDGPSRFGEVGRDSPCSSLSLCTVVCTTSEGSFGVVDHGSHGRPQESKRIQSISGQTWTPTQKSAQRGAWVSACKTSVSAPQVVSQQSGVASECNDNVLPAFLPSLENLLQGCTTKGPWPKEDPLRLMGVSLDEVWSRALCVFTEGPSPNAASVQATKSMFGQLLSGSTQSKAGFSPNFSAASCSRRPPAPRIKVEHSQDKAQKAQRSNCGMLNSQFAEAMAEQGAFPLMIPCFVFLMILSLSVNRSSPA